MSRALDWEREGREWPDRELSRIVAAGNLSWRTVVAGSGPTILLLHGTGASAHSWRGIIPELARHFRVVAPDLPGHAFTRGRPREGLTLRGMAGAIGDLLAALGEQPVMIAGHSAGAAIALQMVVTQRRSVPVIGFNPAISPFRGLAGPMFSTLAKLLLVNPIAPGLLARIARVRGETARFLYRSTGSRIDSEGVRSYETLFGNSRHCAGTLAMMADWNLAGLERQMPTIASPVLLVHSQGDRAVPLSAVEQAVSRLPNARLEVPNGLGHLAHEEDPALAARLIGRFAADHGIGIREAAQ